MEHRIYHFTKSTAPAEVQLESSEGMNGHATTSTHSTEEKVTDRSSVANGTPVNPLTPVIGAAKERVDAFDTRHYRSITLSDARISLFFLYLLQSAFFSTGNIASVSSFSLDAVYRLIPVFDPFSQGALLIVKLLIPFALISANLGILNRRLGVAPSALFMLVTAFSDVLTLSFFWMVRDEGSWLEIGETISRFVIASVLCVFVAALEALSEVFVGGVEFVDEERSHVQSHQLSSTDYNGVSSGLETKRNGSIGRIKDS